MMVGSILFLGMSILLCLCIFNIRSLIRVFLIVENINLLILLCLYLLGGFSDSMSFISFLVIATLEATIGLLTLSRLLQWDG